MKHNVTYSIGNLAVIDKADAQLGGYYFEHVFGKIAGKAHDFVSMVKLFTPNGFRFHILANISPEILSILGDFIDKYRDKTLSLRW